METPRLSNPLLDLPNEILNKISENLSTKDFKNFRNITSETRNRLNQRINDRGLLSHPEPILDQIISYLSNQYLKNLGMTSSDFEILTKKKRSILLLDFIRKIFEEQNLKLLHLPTDEDDESTESIEVSDVFQPLIRLLVVIKNNYFLFSHPYIKSFCLSQLEKLKLFLKDLDLSEDLNLNRKGIKAMITALQQIIKNILPMDNPTSKTKFISELEELMIDLIEIKETNKIDILQDLLVDIVDLCTKNLNHIQDKFVKECLDILQKIWVKELDGLDDGAQSTPQYARSAIERLNIILFLQNPRINPASFLSFMWTY
jgi:hypothetical protein